MVLSTLPIGGEDITVANGLIYTAAEHIVAP